MKTANFEPMLAKALRNKAEITYCVDEWLQRLKEKKLDIELCDKAVRILRNYLKVFRRNILAMNIPMLVKPNQEYSIDIFDDAIQLGLVTWEENARFDNEGFPIDSEEDYKLAMAVPIPSIPLDSWCEMNQVKPGTARQWISRERMRAVKEGRDLRVSPIQYVPDALFANTTRAVRFDGLGELPENISAKFPFLSGTILCIMLLGRREKDNVLVISYAAEGEQPTSHSHTVSDAERTWLLRALLKSDAVRCRDERHFHSPLPDANWAGKERFPIITPAKEDVKVVFDAGVMGKCQGALRSKSGPIFELVMGNGDYVKGTVFHLHEDAEEGLMRAIFGKDEGAELREGLMNQAHVTLSANYPWDEYVLLVTEMKVSKENALVLKSLRYCAQKTCAVETSMTAFALKKDTSDTEANAEIILGAGYREVMPGEDYEWEHRLFFAYTQF